MKKTSPPFLSTVLTNNTCQKLSLLFFGLMLSSISYASGEIDSNGFVSGFSHPILGFDHLIAMISVGVLSTQIGGRAVWVVPANFVFAMLLGSVVGIFGLPLPNVEFSIALSVLLLGLAIAIDKKFPLFLSMIFVSFFALFHGYAHGAEMPSLAQPVLYASGFLLATTLLHIVGVGIGEGMKRMPKGTQLIRLVGVGVAVAGCYIMFG